MISKLAVKQFVERPLRDSRKVKRWTTEQLDALLRKQDATFPTSPRGNWQKACFLLGLARPGYIFLLEQGLGKTWTALNLFLHHRRLCTAGKYRGLVLVPFGSNVPQWVREAKKHAPGLRVLGISGSKEQREEILDSKADLLICTYMGWLRFCCTMQQKKKGKGQELAVDVDKIDALFPRFKFVAYDECSFLGNHQSTSFKVLRHFLRYAEHRYGLTGTPFGMYPEDLWSQFYLVDGGETLGKTLGLYREAFFIAKKRFWGRGFDYKFDERKKQQLARMLRHGSIRYAEKECFELPKLVPIPMPVSWPEEAWAYYQKLLEKLQKAQDKEDRQKTENVWMRMRQLASGYIRTKGARGEAIHIDFAENPKLDTLVDKLKELPPGRQAIVYNEFVHSGDVLCARLQKEKIKHLRLYSGTSKKIKDTMEERFNNDPSIKCLVMSQSGAFGLNLQAANYLYVYESPVSPIVRKQLEKRAHRQGQTRRVFMTDIYVKNSVEERILGSLAKGRDLFEALVEGKVKAKELLWHTSKPSQRSPQKK